MRSNIIELTLSYEQFFKFRAQPSKLIQQFVKNLSFKIIVQGEERKENLS